jgi:glycerate 2-kinase
MRAEAEAIFRAAIKAVEPAAAVRRVCRRENERFWIRDHVVDLTRIDRILVVGAGKATAAMAQAIEGLLGDRISDGLISVKYGHTAPLRHIRMVEAGHPHPDANGMAAAGAILGMAASAGERDLMITLLSGGGSALLPLPAAGLTLADKQAATDLLLTCGATIHEINMIRKHLSAIKGGRLARAAAPAAVITLILSDVVGDDLDVIASGPCVPDSSTFDDCLQVISRHAIEARLPRAVRAHLKAGAAGRTAETPKADTHPWKHVRNIIIGSNTIALEAAAHHAQSAGYHTCILSAAIQGEARTVARRHARLARDVLAGTGPVPPPACILSGGETTVTVLGRGRGGRNQEFALAAAAAIDNCCSIVVLSAGTDGTDGPTDAAGAIADHTTAARSQQVGLDMQAHLENNDAYPFFKALGDLLTTGPTGTNVMDLNVLLIRRQESA